MRSSDRAGQRAQGPKPHAYSHDSARGKLTGARSAQRKCTEMSTAPNSKLAKRATFGSGVVLLVATSAVAGQELRLNDLVAEALANNPEIAAAQKRYEAA